MLLLPPALKAKLSDMVLDLEFGDDIDLSELDLADILQAVIFESEGAIRCFEVEAALTCSRVLPRQVGGWCSLVTADEVRSMHTGSWLCAQRKACGISDAASMVAVVDKTDTGHA